MAWRIVFPLRGPSRRRFGAVLAAALVFGAAAATSVWAQDAAEDAFRRAELIEYLKSDEPPPLRARRWPGVLSDRTPPASTALTLPLAGSLGLAIEPFPSRRDAGAFLERMAVDPFLAERIVYPPADPEFFDPRSRRTEDDSPFFEEHDWLHAAAEAGPRFGWQNRWRERWLRPRFWGGRWSPLEWLREPPPAAPRVVILPLQLDLGEPAGEFEPHDAIAFACCELVDHFPDLLVSLVTELAPVKTLLLVNDPWEHERARDILDEAGAPTDHVRYVPVPHNTMWLRDYGPLTLRNRHGEIVLIDGDYGREDRQEDNEAPGWLAEWLGLPALRTPLVIEGGNLLGNGCGLVLTTHTFVERNLENGLDRPFVSRELERLLGAAHVVFLEPLLGEPNGHIDMFAAFTAADVVVVGQFDPAVDPVNAAVLDRNAARLAQLRLADGRPMRVERIPMPPHTEECWPTYTNAIFANGVVIMPIYPATDPTGGFEAMDLYNRLLPGWRVVTVDATELAELSGVLHCICVNLARPEPRVNTRISPTVNTPFNPR